MKIDVMHLAKLARLTIDENERPRFEAEMAGIVEMVEKLPPIEGKLTADPANRMALRPDRTFDAPRSDFAKCTPIGSGMYRRAACGRIGGKRNDEIV